jgi:hypothetical protein
MQAETLFSIFSKKRQQQFVKTVRLIQKHFSDFYDLQKYSPRDTILFMAYISFLSV